MQGTVTTGAGKAASFVPLVADLIDDEVGFRPYAGTINLSGVDVSDLPERVIEDPSLGMDNCRGVGLRPCTLDGVRSATIRPLVDDYPDQKVEVVAPVHVRKLFGLEDGDSLSVTSADDLWEPGGMDVRHDELDRFDGVVFDLDQTLVDLEVDWDDVTTELEGLLGEYIDFEKSEQTETRVASVARNHGLYDAYVDLLAEYELAGAKRATPTRLLDTVTTLDCPIGICTRNAESAAEKALERFGVRHTIDAIVGRETVPEQKPHPEPLQCCLDELGIKAGTSVFIGDDPSDCEAAERVGMSFLHPNRLSTEHPSVQDRSGDRNR